MNTVISGYYYSLVETLNHMKSLKLKDCLGENVADCYDVILVYVERLESSGDFNPNHLSCIIFIFGDTSDSRFCLQATQNYKQVMEFIKKLCVCDKDSMQTYDIITYGSLVEEAMRE